MTSESFKLDRLPIEILRRIASVATCEAVLASSKVNRTLRAACNDPLVYKAIIDNRNGNGGPRWYHHLPLSMQSPVSSWARYALANSKAAHDRIASLKPTSIVSWAPQLIAYHHPFVNIADALALTLAYDSETSQIYEPRDTNSTYALAFCIALRLMSEDPATVLGPEWPTQDETTPWAPGRDILGGHLKQSLPDSCIGKCSHALMVVGFFSVLLREAFEIGRTRRQQSLLPQSFIISFPTPTSIPFHLLMDVPLPFSSDATEKFASCHLAKMTTVDFLQDGEWTGIYGMSFNIWRPALFDPPMRGVRFAAVAKSGGPTTLYGDGEDSVGAFHLEGILAPSIGDISMTKTYEGGFPAWDWKCLMTPVGIVGCWGRADYGGWLWLWKTGWTAGL